MLFRRQPRLFLGLKPRSFLHRKASGAPVGVAQTVLSRFCFRDISASEGMGMFFFFFLLGLDQKWWWCKKSESARCPIEARQRMGYLASEGGEGGKQSLE